MEYMMEYVIVVLLFVFIAFAFYIIRPEKNAESAQSTQVEEQDDLTMRKDAEAQSKTPKKYKKVG
jgi:cbb3-type cytochrome oxidase subunit 3